MSCPKTEYLLQEYFADDLTPLASEEFNRHIEQCPECGAERDALLQARRQLESWQDERVPHWDRHQELFRREHRASSESRGWLRGWQWFPTAASFAMLCLMIFNTTIVSTEEAVSISFGSVAPPPAAIDAELEAFEARQEAALQTLVARMEDRQDSNNVQLLQAVLEQAQQTTSENFERMYSYFEQQRLQDLQGLRAGYQELVDSDYQTIRTLEQLAQYVSYDANLR